MIDPQTSWQLVKQNAQKAVIANMVWHSLIQDKSYRIKSIDQTNIVIERMSGGEDQILTKERVEQAVVDFNTQNCRVKRRHLISPTVAEETAFVLFHPDLTWDTDGDYIVESNRTI